MIEIKKLDRRYKGHEHFQYYVKVSEATLPWNLTGMHTMYHTMREWCWSTWGASKELNEWIFDLDQTYIPACQNEFWCWQNDEYFRRIYLRTDKEMMLFKLRWE